MTYQLDEFIPDPGIEQSKFGFDLAGLEIIDISATVGRAPFAVRAVSAVRVAVDVLTGRARPPCADPG
jgi:hypothetical protein